MALAELQIHPGLFTLKTDRGSKNRWKTGNHVRFHNGLPQKIGGWTKNTSGTFLGICRGITDWITLGFTRYIGLGTHLKLYVWSGGTFYDITPIRKTVNPMANNPFAVTNGSAVVTVTDTAHGAIVGDFVTFSGASAVATVTINGAWQVASVIDANTYTFTAASNANATTSGGGAIAVAVYQINTGSQTTSVDNGYGIGPYGGGTWGTPRTAGTGDLITQARTWTLDQWGEDLVVCPRDGGIYVWDSSVGTGTPAAVISGAPLTAKGIFVSPQDKHLVAYGAYDGSVSDPLLIRWSDSNDYTYWTTADGHTAGTKRITTGTAIITHVKTALETCLFTDSNLWVMSFLGQTGLTFGFEDKGSNGKIMGPNAAIQIDGKVYWMAEAEFFVYDGTISPLMCEVYNHVFESINIDQRFKISCGYNKRFREIWWFYPSANATENDSYVTYNIYERTWSFGTLARTMYVGNSKIYSDIYATGTDGYIYDHESGTDDNASPMTATLASWDMELGSGDDVMHMSRCIPDFKALVGNVSMTLVGRKFPQDTDVVTRGPYTITPTSGLVRVRMRCRQVSINLQSSSLGDYWRFGGIRPDVQPDGKR